MTELKPEKKPSILEQPPDEYLEVCPICGSNQYHQVHDRGAIYNDPNRTTEVRTQLCHHCSVLFINPRLSEKKVKEFYQYEQGLMHKNQNMKDLLNQSPKALTKVRMGFFDRWLMGTEKILEVGGGGLNFAVSMAKQYKNIQLDELDPSLPHNDHLLPNLRLVSGFLDHDYSESISGRYDVVVAFHVLEHQYNPKHFLNLLKKILRDKGLIFLEVPYPFSPFWLRNPIHACFRTVHPFNFTIRSLKYLLNDAGFMALDYDMSSLTMLRLTARATQEAESFVPLSKHELLKIDSFLRSWKIYSKICHIKSISKFAHIYAEWVWSRNHDINQL